jgi:two-component system cell cycle sensor histidine kinase/response regulator CckA
MEAATRERLFEPFFSTKSGERGSGLGLSTVYGIVQRIGGSIQVDSEPGAGTRIEIWLPEDHTVPEDAEPTTPPRPEPGIARTVLLVEDEPAIRRLLSAGLRRAGHRVIEADDGEHALRVVGNEPVDIVVSDVVMPNMRGPQLLRRLRSTRPGLPAILISGNADFFDRAGIAQFHRTKLLQKPFGPPELLAAMTELLDDPSPGSG